MLVVLSQHTHPAVLADADRTPSLLQRCWVVDGKQPSGKIKVLYDSAVQKLLDELGLSLLDAANKSEWHNITRPEALAAQARTASGVSAQVAAKRPSRAAVTKGAASSTSRAATSGASVGDNAANATKNSGDDSSMTESTEMNPWMPDTASDAAAPLVTVTWQWQQRAVWRQLGVETWMPREHAQRAPGPLPQWSGYVMPLALVSGIKEAEPHLAKQLLYSGIVKDLGSSFT